MIIRHDTFTTFGHLNNGVRWPQVVLWKDGHAWITFVAASCNPEEIWDYANRVAPRQHEVFCIPQEKS